MAKVPIEIIVQDYVPEETPGDDTPGTITPEESDTTEELSVPDTGLFSNNPTATIITSSSILLFVIATIIALFAIRKQHKATKQAKQTNKANQAKTSTIVTVGTLSIITITALLTELIFSSIVQPTLSNAASEHTTIETPDKITIEITRTEDEDTFTATTKTTNTIISNSDYGYELSISMDNSDLCLVNDEDNEESNNEEEPRLGELFCITPTESSELGINTWGYTTDNIEEVEDITYHNFSEPLVIESDEPTEGTTIDIYYAVKLNKDLPAGTYTSISDDDNGGIEYTIEPKGPRTISGLTYMQEMTHEICEATPTPAAFDNDGNIITDVPTATLIDNRGETPKSYTVAKLADGNCWMTQNLDLDIVAGHKYTNEDTDLGWNAETSSYGEAEWIPSQSTHTSNDAEWGVESENFNPNFNPESYDFGDACWSGVFRDGTLVDCNQNNMHYHLGNYYNWNAAVATNNTSDYGEDGINIDQSICPAGWTLPRDGRDLNNNDFAKLISRYGGIEMQNAPIYFVWGGYWIGGLNLVGFYGAYWLSTASNSNNAYNLELYGEDTNYLYGARRDGLSIRCIAR